MYDTNKNVMVRKASWRNGSILSPSGGPFGLLHDGVELIWYTAYPAWLYVKLQRLVYPFALIKHCRLN